MLVALGGAEMLVTLRAPLGVLLHVGPQGLAAYLMPTILVLCGVLLVATPQQRVFHALALVGGALAFAWTPDKQRAARPEPITTQPEEPVTAGQEKPVTAYPAEPFTAPPPRRHDDPVAHGEHPHQG
ncbi:DUF6114 domain-containing protein [Micromonospora sp. WMMD980]|uniref:DUF6114 domain-containing protein n=1 Tax=Micromonospora sp. WMMD980 TaxID=3016088 RepID=UPI0024170EA0|nr:DUF6114 domain-containing protein [Micromonospora sp. WMMD980]MDG4799858.1 DUF6114 domain-containing protein [Micromonospora sp. WMMD980]